MKKITLADGTEILDGSILRSGENQIIVLFPGKNIVEAVATFSDPTKTSEMVSEVGVYRRVYSGYTTVVSVWSPPGKDRVEIQMTGENLSFEETITVPEQYMPEGMIPEHTEGASANG